MPRFMLSDGRGLYLRRDKQGNYVPVKNIKLGDVWTDRAKASNVLVNCIGKNFRYRYRIIELEDEPIVAPTTGVSEPSNAEVVIKPKDNVAKRIGAEPVEENHLSSWENDINSFADFAQSAEERRETLIAALSDVDKEISDINHYIEFGQFNAYQGWLAFNMLRGRLKKRRKVKDELQILTQLGECKVNSAMIEEIKASIGKLSTREYQPRKLTELFE